MRFCHPFTLIAGSRGKKASRSHRRIGLKPTVQCDQAQLIVFFPRAIFLQPIARSTLCPKNLTEFPFAHTFSKHRDKEALRRVNATFPCPKPTSEPDRAQT
jgi:hypothetical protein